MQPQPAHIPAKGYDQSQNQYVTLTSAFGNISLSGGQTGLPHGRGRGYYDHRGGGIARHYPKVHNSRPPREDTDISVRVEPLVYTRELDGVYNMLFDYHGYDSKGKAVSSASANKAKTDEVRITIFKPEGWNMKESRVIDIESELIWQVENHADRQGYLQRYNLVTTGKKHSEAIPSSSAGSITSEAKEATMKCRQVIRIDSNFPLHFYAVSVPDLDLGFLGAAIDLSQDKAAGNTTPNPDHFVIDINRHPGKLISANGRECRPKRKPPVDSMDMWRVLCAQQKKELVEEMGGMGNEELAKSGIDVMVFRKNQAAEMEKGNKVGGGGGY